MLIRSLIAVVLSIPATFAIVGLVLVLTPQTTNIILPVLLLVFPVWVTLTVCSYLIAESRRVAVGLLVIAALGFALIALLRTAGLAVL
ncbi:MAG: hypothetical protein CMQ44_04305 [Gammaproteobacteria bacterium]|nr:hypothetical protein [Gammaproteobacteria bacterium]|tara:strand:+ start:2057 stop:2320 length:264 start_codon:yes stop_codon:yes gene_type:complete